MNKIGINLFLALVIGVLVYLAGHGNLEIAVMVPAAMLAARLVTVRGPLIYWVVFAEFSNLQMPVTFTRAFSLAFLLQLLFIGGEILYYTVDKERPRFGRSSQMLFWFLILLAITAKTTGFGIYLLGSSDIGGLDYIILAVRVGFMAMAAAYIDRYGLDLKRLLKFALAGALIMSFFNLLLYFIPALSRVVRPFVNIGFVRNLAGYAVESRFVFLYILPFTLLPFVMSVQNVTKRNLLAGACILLAAMSGFRTALMLTGFLFVLAEFKMYGMTVSRAMTYVLLGFFGLVFLWVFAPDLNPRIQRALTLIPGFASRIPPEVQLSAHASTEWRLELYRVCLGHLHEYLFIGRGLGIGLKETLARFSALGVNAEFFYEGRAYHLALFELWLDYGMVGGVLMVSSWFLRIRESARRCRLAGGPSVYEQYSMICLLGISISMLTYFSDFRASFFPMLLFGYVATACAGAARSPSAKHALTKSVRGR